MRNIQHADNLFTPKEAALIQFVKEIVFALQDGYGNLLVKLVDQVEVWTLPQDRVYCGMMIPTPINPPQGRTIWLFYIQVQKLNRSVEERLDALAHELGHVIDYLGRPGPRTAERAQERARLGLCVGDKRLSTEREAEYWKSVLLTDRPEAGK